MKKPFIFLLLLAGMFSWVPARASGTYAGPVLEAGIKLGFTSLQYMPKFWKSIKNLTKKVFS